MHTIFCAYNKYLVDTTRSYECTVIWKDLFYLYRSIFLRVMFDAGTANTGISVRYVKYTVHFLKRLCNSRSASFISSQSREPEARASARKIRPNILCVYVSEALLHNYSRLRPIFIRLHCRGQNSIYSLPQSFNNSKNFKIKIKSSEIRQTTQLSIIF